MSVLQINALSASIMSALSGKRSLKKAKSQLASMVLQPLRQRLESFEIENPQVAKFIAKSIPAQCPFERDIVLFGRKVAHIPPMCKLNPFYEQLVSLRFRALCYLADRCGEDIQAYC